MTRKITQNSTSLVAYFVGNSRVQYFLIYMLKYPPPNHKSHSLTEANASRKKKINHPPKRHALQYTKKRLMIVIYKSTWENDSWGTLALSQRWLRCPYCSTPFDTINSWMSSFHTQNIFLITPNYRHIVCRVTDFFPPRGKHLEQKKYTHFPEGIG